MSSSAAIAIVAAVGAWLLFAGPLLQAAVELRNDTPRGSSDAARPAQVRALPSAWWWLLPPVALWQHHRADQEARRQRLASMGDGELRQALSFSNKAVGWLLVAFGALCIAVKETWEAGEHVHLPESVRWLVMLVAVLAATTITATAVYRQGRLLTHGGATGGRRGAQEQDR
jgi:hypothetical protein